MLVDDMDHYATGGETYVGVTQTNNHNNYNENDSNNNKNDNNNNIYNCINHKESRNYMKSINNYSGDDREHNNGYANIIELSKCRNAIDVDSDDDDDDDFQVAHNHFSVFHRKGQLRVN